MDDLKPCPFCGGKAQYFCEALCLSVRCSKCKASVGWVINTSEDAQAIHDAWNTRTPDLAAEVLRLRAEVDDWKSRAEFAEAQLEAVLEQLPPPAAGLLKQRLAEKTAGSRTPTS